MGYEIAGGLGVKRAAPDRDVIVMVGDGSYLMMHTEIVTAVAEGIKVIIVLIQNHGFASIGALSDSLGSQRFGTKYRYLEEPSHSFETGERLPIDLATNAESLGIDVIRIEQSANALADLTSAMATAKASTKATLIHINSDPMLFSPKTETWWEVPVAEVSELESTTAARKVYLENKANQKPYL